MSHKFMFFTFFKYQSQVVSMISEQSTVYWNLRVQAVEFLPQKTGSRKKRGREPSINSWLFFKYTCAKPSFANDGSRSAHSAGSSKFFDQNVSKMRHRSNIALWWEYSPHSHVTSFG